MERNILSEKLSTHKLRLQYKQIINPIIGVGLAH